MFCEVNPDEANSQVLQVEQVSRWSKYLNRHEEAEPEEQNSPEGKTGLTDRLHPHGNIKNTR